MQEVHGEQRGMRYGLHLPRTSQVGNQVHQDDRLMKLFVMLWCSRRQLHGQKFGVEPIFFGNDATREFFSLMNEKRSSFVSRLSKYSNLFFTIKLYHIKCLCGITDNAMSMFKVTLRFIPRRGHSSSFYEAKKIINRLGLNYEIIDALPKHCMLYWERTLGGDL
ncbi:hypothetical protein K1719_045385 [Acacia pycnantha]|nr:hypothetical protein K1719_045385 [Acacia pycnantha]